MSPFLSILRRSLWLVLLAAIGGSIYAWWRDRSTATPPDTPQWPPLDGDSPATSSSPAGAPPARSAAVSGAATASATASRADAPKSTTATTATTTADRPAPSVVNALVDAPDARPAGSGQTWVEPEADGSCPDGYPIKANDNSGIFHIPGGRFYGRTKAERCYASADDATADGYRQAKS
jgi:hypothetical protein